MTRRPTPPTSQDPLPWVLLGLGGFVFLSFPWLSPILLKDVVDGVPLFFLYTFGVWLVLIVVAACLRPRP